MPERIPTEDEAIVAALLRERAGYVAQGRADRVADVDAELARRGVTPPDAPAGASSASKAGQRTATTRRGATTRGRG